MEGKLIKVENDYRLLGNNNSIIGTTDLEYQQAFSDVCQKLSLKNCEAIENGYDLMKLAEENSHKYYDVKTTDWHCNYNGFFSGFQKALELLGEKKFSVEDIQNVIDSNEDCLVWANVSEDGNDIKFYLDEDVLTESLQQTEFDVEIEIVQDYLKWKQSDIEDIKDCLVPKLDEDSCLILKRK